MVNASQILKGSHLKTASTSTVLFYPHVIVMNTPAKVLSMSECHCINIYNVLSPNMMDFSFNALANSRETSVLEEVYGILQ